MIASGADAGKMRFLGLKLEGKKKNLRTSCFVLFTMGNHPLMMIKWQLDLNQTKFQSKTKPVAFLSPLGIIRGKSFSSSIINKSRRCKPICFSSLN